MDGFLVSCEKVNTTRVTVNSWRRLTRPKCSSLIRPSPPTHRLSIMGVDKSQLIMWSLQPEDNDWCIDSHCSAGYSVQTVRFSVTAWLWNCATLFTQRRSVANSVGCFQRRLSVCVFISKRVNIWWWNLGVGALYKHLGRVRIWGS